MLRRLSRIVLALAACWTAAPSPGQDMAMPAVDATCGPPVLPAGPPPMLPAQPMPPYAPPVVEVDPDMPKDPRPGVFQKIYLDTTWLARFGNGGFGMTDLELSPVFGLPLPTRQWPLVITPGFAVHYLDGPSGADLPPQVYDAYTEFRWIPRIGRLKADLAVTPGVHSDFQTGRDALRITGRGAGIWAWTPTARIVLGAMYLDRRDVNVLPIAGIVWTPDDESRYELVFPRPKIAHRVYWNGNYRDDIEYWLYLAAELGGGIWAFEHATGEDDVFSYRDYRIMVGGERKVLHGLSSHVEIGYVFWRRIEFQNAAPDITPSDTLMVRGGLAY